MIRRTCVCVCTVGAEQGLKLGEEADGVELSEESVVTETVPQFDNEATDESSELQHTSEEEAAFISD